VSLSGKRHKYVAPAGTGTVGAVDLACGHQAHGEPTVTQPSKRLEAWLCSEGCGFQPRARKRKAAA
jgi:hypothetical protein